jgi:raffinose/stachyose/melibiose transport system permease protein
MSARQPQRQRQSQRQRLRLRQGRLGRVLVYAVLVVLALFALGPLVTLVFDSLKTNAAIGASPLTPPSHPQLSNFATAWTQGDFSVTMRNSVIICLGTMLGVCLIAGLAAYALSQFDLPGGNGMIAYLFLGTALPVQLFLVPLFFLWTRLHLTNNLLGLIIIFWATESPFATLLLRSYMLKIPREFLEAARLDGASELRSLFRVLLPLAWPGLMTIAVISGLFAWNEFFFSITFIFQPALRPIATSFLAFQDQNSTNWGLTSAAALFMVVPALLLFLGVQRRFVSGLTSGGLR